jgi:hypothetical protein
MPCNAIELALNDAATYFHEISAIRPWFLPLFQHNSDLKIYQRQIQNKCYLLKEQIVINLEIIDRKSTKFNIQY